MAYELSETADSDVVFLYLTSCKEFGTIQAERYFAGLTKMFEFLAENPKAARLHREFGQPVYLHPYGAHHIIYEIVEGGDILVLRVLHGRQDIGKYL